MISKLFLINNKKNLIKKVLLSRIFKITKKNINNISTFFIQGKARFGNYMQSVNNAIIYCEFLCCKKILLFKNIVVTIFSK
jgi:hypothetical protein